MTGHVTLFQSPRTIAIFVLATNEHIICSGAMQIHRREAAAITILAICKRDQNRFVQFASIADIRGARC